MFSSPSQMQTAVLEYDAQDRGAEGETICFWCNILDLELKEMKAEGEVGNEGNISRASSPWHVLCCIFREQGVAFAVCRALCSPATCVQCVPCVGVASCVCVCVCAGGDYLPIGPAVESWMKAIISPNSPMALPKISTMRICTTHNRSQMQGAFVCVSAHAAATELSGALTRRRGEEGRKCGK